ncbi:hypothetical protein [Aquimarina sp. Aq107]|uniref:hypothetical protein n=1 Tax=Aquimarina sp. Aq107 TaxID=1191912 RepID=UPI000D560A20|nr:hypothetical protein [Aquimarina sp. Aq107]
MRKITIILLLGIFTFFSQNCSSDEHSNFEENIKIKENFNSKNNGASSSDSVSLTICQIAYIFNDPNITLSEKEIIRKRYHTNHFRIYDYTIISNYKEIWSVNCLDYETYNENNPNCDTDGCYSCAIGGCGSSDPEEDGPDDPFEIIKNLQQNE